MHTVFTLHKARNARCPESPARAQHVRLSALRAKHVIVKTGARTVRERKSEGSAMGFVGASYRGDRKEGGGNGWGKWEMGIIRMRSWNRRGRLRDSLVGFVLFRAWVWLPPPLAPLASLRDTANGQRLIEPG